jgi:nitrate/nitrite transporter NarK
MSTLPGPGGSMLIWGFFGLTTILLFWAALIRATRDWGGRDEQGRAFGLLDSGRGVLAAGLASIGAASFALLFPEGYGEASFEDKKEALRLVILGYSLVTALSGVFVWFALKERVARGPDKPKHWKSHEGTWPHIARVLRIPAVWLISLGVVCAYVAYKGFDNYSLYAVQGFGLDDVEAAHIVALGAWMRPVAALAAGLLGDRFLVSRMTVVCFAVLLFSQLFFAIYTPQPSTAWVLLINVLIGSAATFGLRGLYYALFEESKVPIAVTGTAVGLVSVLGYTPDIFVSYIGGVLLDNAPGLAGHQHYFWFLAAFAALGLVVSIALMVMLNAHRRGAANLATRAA